MRPLRARAHDTRVRVFGKICARRQGGVFDARIDRPLQFLGYYIFLLRVLKHRVQTRISMKVFAGANQMRFLMRLGRKRRLVLRLE